MKNHETYSQIRKQVKKLLPYQVGTFLLALTTVILSVSIINLLQNLVDMLYAHQVEEALYWKLGITCSCYAVLMLVFQFVFKRTQIIGANEVTILLFQKLQGKKLHFYKKNKAGEILSLINNEGKEVGDWLSFGVLVLLNECAVLVMNLVMMCYYDMTLTLILLIIMFAFFMGTRLLASKMANLSSDSLKITSKVNSFILETVRAESVIQTLHKNQWFRKKFVHMIEKEKYPIDNKKADCTAVYMTIFAMVSIMMPILAVIIGAVLSERNGISGGVLLAFYAHTMQIQEPVRSIPEFLSKRKNTLTIAEHLKAIMDDTDIRDERENVLQHKIEKLSVDIRKFSYEDTEVELLKNVRFELLQKDILVIKGDSGAGKSTLASILMGFEDADSVTIKYGTIPAKEVSNAERWKHILLAGQIPLLLEATVRENVLLGEEVSEQALQETFYTVCLENFVKEQGLEKVIGGENDGVSGGQKQRISMARVLLRKPDILILDEPTAALDAETSLILAKRLVDYAKKNDMMLIVITHKNEFDKYATKTLEVEKC